MSYTRSSDSATIDSKCMTCTHHCADRCNITTNEDIILTYAGATAYCNLCDTKQLPMVKVDESPYFIPNVKTCDSFDAIA